MVRRAWWSLPAVAVAAALLAQPASAARVYGGQPTPGAPAQFVLSLSDSGTAVTKITFHAGVSCGEAFTSVDSGTTQTVQAPPDQMLSGAHYLVGGRVSGGRLTGTILGADRVNAGTWALMNIVLSGTVTKTKASGTMAAKFVHSDEATGAEIAQCSRTSRWSAQRDPGVVYAGATSQDEPVVVELKKGRRQISHAHVSWYAPCAGGGAWIDPHDEFDLRPFALSRTGTFSRSYAFNLGRGTAEVERFAGRVGPTKAGGTFQSDVTIAGTATNTTCGTGRVSWTAATG